MEQLDQIVIAWLVFAAILGLLEFVIPGAILGFLGLSAVIIAMLLHFSVISGFIQTGMTFFVVSLFMIIFIRSLCLKVMPGDLSIQNTDEDQDAIGSIVEVLEDIEPNHHGRIRFRGTTWEAESTQAIKPGEKAVITGRRASIWIISPIEKEKI